MAKCFMTYDKSTGTWFGVASLNDRVIASTQAWSKAGVITQLTEMIGRR